MGKNIQIIQGHYGDENVDKTWTKILILLVKKKKRSKKFTCRSKRVCKV